MSYKTKDLAMQAAKRMKKRMKNPGWKIRVWENIDWHFSLQLPVLTGGLSLSVTFGKEKYMCMGSSYSLGSGENKEGYVSHATQPNKAVQKVLVAVRGYASWQAQFLHELEKCVANG